MPFVHMNVCSRLGSNLLSKLGKHVRCNSTAHDSLWFKNKVDESRLSVDETRALSYSSKNSLKPQDDVYNRLKLIQQKRCLNVSKVLSEPVVTRVLEVASSGSGGPGGDKEKKGLSKEVLASIFVFFVASGVLIKLYLGDDKEKEKQDGSKKHSKPLRIPASSDSLPNHIPYLLIGGGTASFSAFRAIKTNDPTAKILVVSQEPHNPYMRPPLSKEMYYNEDRSHVQNLKFKQWNGTIRSIFYEPDEFYMPCEELVGSENGGISVAKGWSVKVLDPTRKIAYLNDGKQIKYDKCLLATGSRPKVEKPFDSINSKIKDKFNFYRGIKDFQKLENAVAEGATDIVIVGNGFLGSELACALGRRGQKKLKITQVFKEDKIMSKVLPTYLCKWTTDKVVNEGVTIKSNSEVIAIGEKGSKVELRLNDGSTLLADQVIVASGAEPVVDLAELAGLEVDSNLGGYLVNSELSARTDLYAAGDCACFYDVDLGRRRVEHHDHAVISGRLAGENMAGAHKIYTHQPMFWSDLGTEIGFEAIGIIDSTLPTVGVFAQKDDTISEEKQKLKKSDEYNKGVIFYLKNDLVVGIILWNLFNKMDIARLILREKKQFKDLNEVAKLFNIYNIKESDTSEAKAATSAA